MRVFLASALSLLLFFTTSGPNSPGTVADDASFGTVAWSNPSNAAASDDTYATAAGAASQLTHYLKATGFGFAVPGGATIDGIVVEVENKASSGLSTNRFVAVRIVKGGAIGAESRATDDNIITATEEYNTFGSSSALWGETWSAADINASDFGVAVSVRIDQDDDAATTISIDHIRITVHYTESSGSSSATTMLMGSNR